MSSKQQHGIPEPPKPPPPKKNDNEEKEKEPPKKQTNNKNPKEHLDTVKKRLIFEDKGM